MKDFEIVGKLVYSIDAPWARTEGRSSAEHEVMRKKLTERLGVAAVLAATRCSAAVFVSSAGFSCKPAAYVEILWRRDWSTEQINAVGHELTKLVYAELGVDEEAERAARLADEEPDRLWNLKRFESTR